MADCQAEGAMVSGLVQVISLHSLRGLPDAPELVEQYGLTTKDLWAAASRQAGKASYALYKPRHQ